MDVTLTVAIIAALSGMISPLITSIISSRAAYRNKMIDLYFDKQIQAYSDLIRAGMEYEKSETKENEMNVNDAVPLAALLSAPKTRNAINLYLIFLFSEPHYMKSSRVEMHVKV